MGNGTAAEALAPRCQRRVLPRLDCGTCPRGSPAVSWFVFPAHPPGGRTAGWGGAWALRPLRACLPPAQQTRMRTAPLGWGAGTSRDPSLRCPPRLLSGSPCRGRAKPACLPVYSRGGNQAGGLGGLPWQRVCCVSMRQLPRDRVCGQSSLCIKTGTFSAHVNFAFTSKSALTSPPC